MADYTPYDNKELEALKRDIVKLDVNVEQYDKQIQRCTNAIKEFEDNIQKIKTEMLVNQHVPKKKVTIYLLTVDKYRVKFENFSK